MNDVVKLQIKIDGNLKEVEVAADDLADAIKNIKQKTKDLENGLINSNQMVQAFEQVTQAVQGLQSAMHGLTDAYAVQSAAEARLEQMMRNTMDATDDEIQSIKDLAAEQQKLGVIGDEVILSGAQELATYMQKKESLEALIPVMDDMIAQQYGYNASAESAVSVAQMLGKVFAGETGALKRLGYTFDEAQEAVLKYGTEEEKVAMLTEVVGQIVDGTNAKLAATPYGQIVQTGMAMGDLKETIGKMIAPLQSSVDKIASFSIALAGIGKGISTVKALNTTLKATALHANLTATAQRMLGAAGISAAAGTTALKIAVTGLYAAMTLGLSAAITAIVALITRLANSSRDASDGMDELKEANEAYKSAASNAKAEIDSEIAALKNLMDQGKDTTEAIQKLNEKYGEAFGYHQTAADWYDTLTGKSQTYCRQLGYEAKAKSLSASIGAKIVERDEKQKELDDWKAQVDDWSNRGVFRFYGIDSNKTSKLQKEVSDLDAEIEAMTTEMNAAFGEAANAADQMKGSVDGATESVSWQTMSYEALGKAIQEQAKKVKESIAANNGLAEAEAATLNAMQQRYDAIGKQFDKLTGKVRVLGNEMKRTAQEAILSLSPIGTPTSIAVPETPYANPKPLKGLFDFKNLGEFEQRLTELENIRKQASQDQLPIIDAQIALVQRLKDEFEGVNQTVAASPMETFTKGWGGLKGIGNSIRDIKSALTDTDNAWDALTQTVDGFLGLIQGIQAVVEVIKTITSVTKAFQVVEETATATQIAANASLSTSNTAVAATAAAASVAGIPLVGPELALTWASTIEAMLSAIPKFANGGLVYGPTVGLMGEYGGASSNPEVIAPLSRLRALLGTDGPSQPSEVKFRIEGRELVGIINKQTNINQRSR